MLHNTSLRFPDRPSPENGASLPDGASAVQRATTVKWVNASGKLVWNDHESRRVIQVSWTRHETV